MFPTEEQARHLPLATRMRPVTIEEVVGQEQAVGPSSFLHEMIRRDTVPSLLLFGPPGSGKTTIAHVIAHMTESRFVTVNATTGGVAELRKVIGEAQEEARLFGRRTILFVDEIHRFHKGQQDVLLSYVENGTVTLIGATTENPFFEVQKALLSRLRLIRLEEVSAEAIVKVLTRSLADEKRGLGAMTYVVSPKILRYIAEEARGDVRLALNFLEQACAGLPHGGTLSEERLTETIGIRHLAYDKQGDQHYDVTSAFIKSMRGSDPDAALHYLARMIEAGESPSFIARRILICASEDVGLADSRALEVAVAAATAAQEVGFPEARIILAHAVLYIALAPKSNSVIGAIDEALARVRKGNIGHVPAHLRDAHYQGAKQLGHGKGYRYAHAYAGGWVKQQYLPDVLRHDHYYTPKHYGAERYLVEEWQRRIGQQEGHGGSQTEST